MSELNSALEHPVYNYKVVRQFAVMTVVWGIVGMLVGVLIAAQLAWPALNFDIAWLSGEEAPVVPVALGLPGGSRRSVVLDRLIFSAAVAW